MFTAERIHTCVLEKLTSADSTFFACLLSCSRNRIKERRDKTLIYLLEYLHDPIFLLEAKTDTFGECAKRKQVYSFAAKAAWSERA